MLHSLLPASLSINIQSYIKIKIKTVWKLRKSSCFEWVLVTGWPECHNAQTSPVRGCQWPRLRGCLPLKTPERVLGLRIWVSQDGKRKSGGLGVGRRVRGGGLLEKGVTEDIGIIFEYLHLCICVFVYLCICVFVYLCICIWEVRRREGAGLTQGSQGSEGVWIASKLRQFSKSYHSSSPHSFHLRQRGRRCAGNCQINLKVQPELRNIRSFAYQARVYPEKTGNCQIN